MSENEKALSDDDLRRLWRAVGGRFHGPRVETGTMPEAKLLPFLRSLLSRPDGEAIAGTGGADAVRDLVMACYDEMHGPQCNEEPDDEHVASCLDENGKVVPAGRITFGMIRRAVASLANDAPPIAAAAQGEAVVISWRRRGKFKWHYRESAPTDQSGSGWLPLYDRPPAPARAPEPAVDDGSCCDGYESQIGVLQQIICDKDARIAELEAALASPTTHAEEQP